MATRKRPHRGHDPADQATAPPPAASQAGHARWTLRQIECFVALAERLHFGRAAERMNLTQPAFSRQIKNLEESLGVLLVERDSQNVGLTPAGEAFLRGSSEALTALQNAVEWAKLFQSGFAGSIRIGYTDFAISALLPDILCAFKQAYPRIIIEPSQGATRNLLSDLRERRLDIAFVTGPVSEDGLVSVPVSTNKLLAVLYKSHRLARKRSITLGDLAGEDFIFGNPKLWRHFLQHVNRVFDGAGIQPNVVETAFNSEGLFGLVAGKLGITLYPDCVLNYYRRGLVIRKVDGLEAAVPTVAAWRRDDPSKALDHFRAVLGDCLAPKPPGRAVKAV